MSASSADLFAVKCDYVSKDTLAIYFTKVTPTITRVQIVIAGFRNPYSVRKITSVQLSQFNEACSAIRETSVRLGVTTVSGFPDWIPQTISSSKVILDTQSPELEKENGGPYQEVGYEGEDNQLLIKFTPATSFDPSLSGRFEVYMPYWWQVGTDILSFFEKPATVINACSSTCFTTLDDSWDSNSVPNKLIINYSKMQASCLKSQIEIACVGFKNPIYKGKFRGFQIRTMDTSQSPAAYIDLSEDLELVATSYKEHLMESGDLIINPQDKTINKASTWTFSINLEFPVEQFCKIRILFPDDLTYNAVSVQGIGFMAPTGGGSITLSTDSYRSISSPRGLEFDSCQNTERLTSTPSGQLMISTVTTPSMIKSSGAFYVEIYRGDIVNSESLIAKTQVGVSVPAAELIKGTLTNLKMTPVDSRTQATTGHRIQFTTASTLYSNGVIQIKYPASITLPAPGTIVEVIPGDKQMTARTGTVMVGQIVEIVDVFKGTSPIPTAPFDFNFLVNSAKNQNSALDAGAWEVYTFERVQGTSYDVDTGKSTTSFKATVGNLSANGEIQVTNAITSGTNSTYTLNFIPNGAIEVGGKIILVVPSTVVLNADAVTGIGSCVDGRYTCSVSIKDEQTITYVVTANAIAANSNQSLTFGGCNNPRTTKKTRPFIIKTFDGKGNQIDEGFNASTQMTILNNLTSFNVVSASQVNGAIADFSFSITINTIFKAMDSISFDFPADIKPPTSQKPECLPAGISVKSVSCAVSGQSMQVTFTELTSSIGVFSWIIKGVQNPQSTKPSGSFSKVLVSDFEQNQVLKYTNTTTPITTSILGQLLNPKLEQQNQKSLVPNGYTIKFTPQNPIPSTGVIQLTWPPQVSLSQNVTCIVTELKSHTELCKVDRVNKMIIIAGALDEDNSKEGFQGQITIDLNDVVNPQTNRIGTGFQIRTYADAEMKYSIDMVDSAQLVPRLDCTFPCKDCSLTDPTVCSSCWLLPDVQEQFFNRLNDQGGVCEQSCRNSTTTNGDPNRVCSKCDVSCATCLDLGNVGDKRECLQCATDFPFTLEGTMNCVPSCIKGKFESVPGKVCSDCKSPCSACVGTSNFCTECSTNTTTPLLFRKDVLNPVCIAPPCPDGFTNVGGFCEQCTSPCSKCEGIPSFCLACDGTSDTKVVQNGVCYAGCPLGTTEDSEGLNCLPCQTGCDKCDSLDQNVCLICSGNLLVLDGECITGCPEGYVANKQKTSCHLRTLDDLSIIYFPFLVAFLISVLVILFGKLKKKQSGISGSQVKTEQSTITVVLVSLSPLQWLATAAQAGLAYYYGVALQAYLAAGLFVLFCILNIIYEIVYDCTFNRSSVAAGSQAMIKAKEKEIVELEQKLSKTSDEQEKKQLKLAITNKSAALKTSISKYTEQKDPKFATYKKDHGFVFCLISTFTALVSFKYNKLYYSHFYSFKMFKASWTNESKYRKNLTAFTIVHMLIMDLGLIVIGVAGIKSLRILQNQLWVVYVETTLLSLIDIVLSAIELYKLKQILQYTASIKQVKRAAVASGVEDSDEDKSGRKKNVLGQFYGEFDNESRQEMMAGLIYKVTANKNLFLNNKLDELLDMFGDRRCKSMIEFGTGWDKEEDPRRTVTIPMSPTLLMEKYNGEYKFTVDDMFGDMGDNCYAEAMVRNRQDEAVQGDQGQQEFNNALQRKQAEFLDPTEEDDELFNRKQKSGKRRGRKNKYYAQIDNEDDVDAAEAEHSVNEDSDDNPEAIIAEQQREEEALRRKVEEERLKQEQIKAQRKAALAQAELARKMADEKEQLARAKAEQEEEAMHQAQDALEIQRLRELDKVRRQMQLEEKMELERRNKAEAERQAELKRISEQNRLKYEEEELKRQADLKAQQDRLAAEQSEAERFAKAERDQQVQKQREEFQKITAQRDADELKRKQSQMALDDKQRHEARLTQTSPSRRATDPASLSPASKMQQAADPAKKKEEDAMRRSILDQAHNEREIMRKQMEAQMEQERIKSQKELETLKKQQEDEDRQRKIQFDQEEKMRLAAIEAEAAARRKKDDDERKQREAALKAEEEKILKNKQDLEAEKKRVAQEAQRAMELEKQLQKELSQKELEAQQREKAVLEQNQKLQSEIQQLQRQAKPKLGVSAVVQTDASGPQVEINTPIMADQFAVKTTSDNKGDKVVLTSQFGMLNDSQDDMRNTKIEVFEKSLKEFREASQAIITVPDADQRNFNVFDVIGDWERDEKGNIIRLQDKQGDDKDKQGRLTNPKGYLVNPRGDIVEGVTGKKNVMFTVEDLDERGELPAPFCVEKYNFNPHDMQGDLDFDFDQETQLPIPRLLQTKQGFFVDKKGRRINKHGWLINPNSHIADKHGRIRFDRRQLEDGDLQRLYNFSGKRFDIKDVIGAFEKSKSTGNIMPVSSKDGSHLQDIFGRRVNEKGYLIDRDGSIIDKEGRKIWMAKDLKLGDFPKIFSFSKFNISNVIGDFEMSPLTDPILDKDRNGNLIDKRGRMVNVRGYLIDKDGNIIDKYGKKMFDKAILTAEGEVPKVFRMNLLRSDSTSSLSELMREIEKNQPSEFDEEAKSNEKPIPQMQGIVQTNPEHEGDGDTSVDSLMEDTPANYNIPNQRFDDNYEDYEPIPEEPYGNRDRNRSRKQRPVPQQQQVDSLGNPEMPKMKKKKAKKPKKTAKAQMIEYLMPTRREVNMADAYGGNAKGQFRRPGVKYDKERLMNRIKTPANIPGGRAQLEALANTVAGFNARGQPPVPDQLSARGSKLAKVRHNDFIDPKHRSEMHSNDGGSNLNNSIQYTHGIDMVGKQARSKDLPGRSRSNLPQKQQNRTGQNFNEVDFEKVLGKDIDQFLEDSEWDIESYEKMSQFSRGSPRANSQDHKLRAMEKVYLQRIEKEHDSVGPQTVITAKQSHTTGPTTGNKRRPRDFAEQHGFNQGQVTGFDNQAMGVKEKSNSRSPQQRSMLRNSHPEEVQRAGRR